LEKETDQEEEEEELDFTKQECDWDDLLQDYDEYDYFPRLGVRLFLVCFPSFLRTSATQ
jgi:hypothetical protein